MKRFVSAYNMRRGFTLIEVMVAVLIISVVIMALFQMRGNSSHIFLNINKKLQTNQYMSFLISNTDYGFEKKNITLDMLLDDFDVESDLKLELKKVKVQVEYQELKQIDMSEQNDENITSNVIFEVGKTILKSDLSSASLLRFRIQ